MEKNIQIQKKIDSYLKQFNQNRPGFSYIAKFDSGNIYAGAVGLETLHPPKPLSVNSVFNLASVSKQFTGFAILLLEQQGMISLKDSIFKYYPELGNYVQDITLKHLIHHTGGLADYIDIAESYGITEFDPLTPAETMAHLVDQKEALFAPGTEFRYSNTGYFLLAGVIEKITGKSIKAFSKENIFEKLGMKNTFIADYYPLEKPYAPSFDKDDHGIESTWPHTGDGSVYSTVEDLAIWGENYTTGKVGGKELMKKMTVPLPEFTEDGCKVKEYDTYAVGIFKDTLFGESALHHSGGWSGYSTNFIRFPQLELTVVILSNGGSIDAVKASEDVAQIVSSV